MYSKSCTGEKRNACETLAGKPIRKIPLGCSRINGRIIIIIIIIIIVIMVVKKSQ
jgi:hypothetical protein